MYRILQCVTTLENGRESERWCLITSQKFKMLVEAQAWVEKNATLNDYPFNPPSIVSKSYHIVSEVDSYSNSFKWRGDS